MNWFTLVAIICLGFLLSAHANSISRDEEGDDDIMMACQVDEMDISLLKQNLPDAYEKSLNELSQEYLEAAYFYMGMSVALQKPDVNHMGFSLMCSVVAKRKLKISQAIMHYIHHRGGDVTAVDIKAPEPNEWQNPVQVLRQAISRERQIGAKLLSTFKMSAQHHDPHTNHFLEHEIWDDQDDPLPEFVKHLHRIKVAGPQLGVLASNVEMIRKYKPLDHQCEHI